VSPPGTGAVNITVKTAVGTSATSSADVFTYTTPTPAITVTAVSPASGLTIGDAIVTITGTGFTGVTAVDFGSSSALLAIIESPTQIVAVSPPGTGAVNVTVKTSAGTSAVTSADVFTYDAT
jgi:hypothetical protein